MYDVHMNKIIIAPRTKTVWHKNPISGHEWSTYEPLNGFEVSGGGFFTTTHFTRKSAETEAELRASMNKKFPFIMPRSQREIDKAKRLNLPIPLPYTIMETGELIS